MFIAGNSQQRRLKSTCFINVSLRCHNIHPRLLLRVKIPSPHSSHSFSYIIKVLRQLCRMLTSSALMKVSPGRRQKCQPWMFLSVLSIHKTMVNNKFDLESTMGTRNQRSRYRFASAFLLAVLFNHSQAWKPSQKYIARCLINKQQKERFWRAIDKRTGTYLSKCLRVLLIFLDVREVS